MGDHLAFRVRLAALWIMGMIAFFAYRTIAVSEGVTEVSVLSNDELANVLIVMMAFAFLTLVIGNQKFNRTNNLTAGIVFAIMQVIMLVDGLTAYPSQSFNMMTGASLVFMIALAWFAFRWGKKPKAA